MIPRRHVFSIAGAAAVTALVAAAEHSQRSRPGPRAGYFPNSIVHTHDGRKLRFYDDVVKGKVVAFNMMYTSCTGICPGSTANLKRVQEALADQLGKRVFMYSLTLRPQFDTPEVLRDYAKLHGVGKGWTLLTGQPAEMDAIRRKLGFANDDPAIDADLAQHTGMVRVGNERLDRWAMAPSLGSPRVIEKAIRDLIV